MLLEKIQYCMPDMFENDGLMISYDLLTLDVVICGQTSSPFQYFLFWYFNIKILINPFGERFESIDERNQTFLIPTKKNLDPDPISILVLSWFPTTETSFLKNQRKMYRIFQKLGGTSSIPPSVALYPSRLFSGPKEVPWKVW